MSNPFGTPFGNQQTKHSAFGGATSQQNVFGSSPSLGQQSVFGQTAVSSFSSQTTVNTTAGLFGQSSIPLTAGTQENVFSQPQQTTVGTQQNVFGQTQMMPSVRTQQNLFGPSLLSTAGSKQSLFGQTQTMSSAGAQQSPFGQTQSLLAGTQKKIFGQTQSSTTGNQQSLFGQTPSSTAGNQQSLFGQTPSSTAGTQQSLFGQTPSSTAGTQQSLFGQTPSSTAGNQQSLFGQTPSSTAGTQQSLFSQTPSSTAGNQQSLFGQTPSSTGGTQQSLFGQTPSSTGGTQQSLFGQTPSSTAGTQQNLFGPSRLTTAGSKQSLFGQTQTMTSAGNQQSLFGQTQSSLPGIQKSTFGQTQSSTTGNQQSLFGQTQSSLPGTQKSSFGQTPTSTAGNQQSLFGQTLSSTAQTEQSSFGQNQPSAAGTQQSLFGQNQSSTAGNQQSLFGQTLTSTAGTQQSLFRQTQSLTAGTQQSLFGQTPSSTAKTQQSPFGQNQPSTAGTQQSLFGQTQSSTAGIQQSLFGKNQSTVGNQQSPFGQNQPSTAGTQQSLFGKNLTTVGTQGLASNQESSSGSVFRQSLVFEKQSGEAAVSLFGKSRTTPGPEGSAQSVTVKTAEMDDSKAQSFGVASKASLAGNKTTLPVGLFGKVKQESVIENNEKKTPLSASFSRDKIKEEKRCGDDKQASGLFGKGKALSSTLFGKPLKKEQKEKSFGTEHLENEDENPLDQQQGNVTGRSAAKGLFGKPAYKEDEKESRSSLRRQISEEISTKVAIVCRNVPHKYNTAMNLRSHFKRFGEVTKVFPNQAKMQAIVHFKTHEAATEAKRRGRVLARGVMPMTIFWSSYSNTSTPKSAKSLSDVEEKSSKSIKRRSDTDLMPRSKKPTLRDSDSVDDELDHMLGTQDMKSRLNKLKGSPEKRSRSVSPTPSTSSALDIKPEKIVITMFEGCIARSTSERVHLLKLRDKYIRQNREKPKKDMVKAFIGTCPDMCPEKERYDREDKRQLSYYEIIPGTENIPGRNPQIDHSRAVKEYLRSSPDQDEPLPHELRPMPVLQKTMAYLLQEIADMGVDSRWGDWFDFLWNRTRGIRKDITQQQLNDKDAVGLIEKCARFHIYASERLCEEDMHSFDAKINNENLTKCLQTLKEFYADLEKKHKCLCENEAEFRAYTVLMNLNEGDTLREVQQLRQEVRTSSEMKFALQAYFALNGNNYIRFFRLVNQASFTNACIMHRYFTQVRNKALTLMMKGYSMGNRSAQVPVTELVRLLGFENENEASDFCQHYGFNVTDGEVILDRAGYIEPDAAWPPRRSEMLIGAKLMVPVGVLINGGPFTHTGFLSPVSSFDENNRFHSQVDLPKKGREPGSNNLISGSIPSTSKLQQAEVKVKQEPVSIKEETRIEQIPMPDKPSHKKVPVEFIKDSAKVLFWEVIDELCKSIGEEVQSEVGARLLYSEDFLQSLLDTTLENEIKTVCEEAFTEAEEVKRKAIELELELRRDRVAELLTGDLIDDLIDREAINLATIEIREVKAQLKKECIERVTVDINSELVKEILTEMVADTADDVFETDVKQRLKQLYDLERLVKLSHAGRFWNKWKNEYKAVTKLKRAMEEFPCAPNMQSQKEQLQTLLNVDDERIMDRKFFVSKRAKLTIETPLEIEKHRKETETCALVHRLYRNLLHQTAWAPLDLGRVVGKLLNRKNKWSRHQNSLKVAVLYWKMLLCVPVVEETRINNLSGIATDTLCKWLKVKFSKGPSVTSKLDVKGKVLSLYKCHLFDGPSGRPVNIGVCVRSVEGELDVDDIAAVEEEALYLGTSALLFVLPACPPFSKSDSVRYDTYWSSQYSRLKAVLDVRPRYQGFPLVIVVPVPASQNVSLMQIVKCLHLEEFLDEELLGDIKLLMYDLAEERPDGIDLVDPKVSEQLCESIQWLAKKTKPAPSLIVQYFKDLVDNSLQKYYYTPVQENLKRRKLLQRLNKDPSSLLGLYNTVITHISEVLTSDKLYQVSWPVSEFTTNQQQVLPPSHWNKRDHLEYVFSLVDSLRLPELDDPSSEDWCDVRTNIWKFVSLFAGSECNGAKIKLYSRLNSLIHQLEVDFEEACFFQFGMSDCKPTVFNVPWSTVISLCIDYKLDCVDIYDLEVFDQKETREELRVAYAKDEMESFIPPDSWNYIEADTAILESPTFEDTIKRAVYKAQEERSKAMTKTEVSVVEDPANVSIITRTTEKMSSSLINSLKSERRQSDHFQKYLESALEDSVPDLDSAVQRSALFPLFEHGNQTCAPEDFSAFTNKRTCSFDESSSQRRKSFDATKYFNQSLLDISAIFPSQGGKKSPLPSGRRKSDIGMQELSTLPAKKRHERLSEMYNNDKVMMCLKEPSVEEDLENLKENIKASRRESDMFEKKLRLLLEGQQDSMTTGEN